MLYELIAIVRPGSLNEVREIARNAGLQVLRSGGVVRGYTNWGTFRLPKPTTKHQARHTEGHHFIMRFDASGPVQQAVRRTLSLDPRMIRFSVVKLGNKLDEIKDVPGKVEWNNVKSISDTISADRF
ncbi:37S ribosomal protein Mrp17 [Thermoascus aurantiacus ATCC 26904]